MKIAIDPHDPAFSARADDPQDPSLPAVYLFSNTRSGDGPAYSMAEDGTVLGSHWCSHRGYMRHDLHDRADRLAAIRAPIYNGKAGRLEVYGTDRERVREAFFNGKNQLVANPALRKRREFTR